MRFLLLLSAALLIATPAAAKGPKADINNDGQVTFAEFAAQADARFAAMDTDSDGVVSADERQAFGDLRREHRRERTFERLDFNDDGQVSRGEFMQQMQDLDVNRRASRLDRRAKLDRDGDGTISEAEREQARAKIRERIASGRGTRPKIDADGDGVITRQEYSAATSALFARMDANGDGVLTRGEGGKRKKRFKRRR